jgi:hypothetical protein
VGAYGDRHGTVALQQPSQAGPLRGREAVANDLVGVEAAAWGLASSIGTRPSNHVLRNPPKPSSPI